MSSVPESFEFLVVAQQMKIGQQPAIYPAAFTHIKHGKDTLSPFLIQQQNCKKNGLYFGLLARWFGGKQLDLLGFVRIEVLQTRSRAIVAVLLKNRVESAASNRDDAPHPPQILGQALRALWELGTRGGSIDGMSLTRTLHKQIVQYSQNRRMA